MKPKVWVIILNYKSAELVISALDSLSSQLKSLSSVEVLVVDNASNDGSPEKISRKIQNTDGWSKWASVLTLDRNGGYAFGNNAGIRLALESIEKVDYIHLLNPDTMAANNAVKSLVDFMEKNPKVGITGSLIENRDGHIESSAHRFPSPQSEFIGNVNFGFIYRWFEQYAVSPHIKNENAPYNWVSGASIMVKRDVFHNIGLLDENFFLYFEEIDFCWRAKRAGWETWYVPSSKVIHLEGSITGIHKQHRRPNYWFNSRRRFFVKHYGMPGLLSADLLWLSGTLIGMLRRIFDTRKRRDKLSLSWFMFDLLWGDIKAFLSGSLWKIERQ